MNADGGEFPLYTIALSSCQYPGDMLRRHVAYRSLAKLAAMSYDAPIGKSPPMALFIAGDSIYADATAGLFDPVDPRERYDEAYRKYERALSDTQVTGTFSCQRYSIDDHELINNWEPSADPDPAEEPLDEKTRRQAIFAFSRHQQKQAERIDNNLPTLWGAERVPNGCSVFVMDTRTEREKRYPANQGQARLYGRKQRDALFEWLCEASESDMGKADVPVTPKIILSGSMLLPRRRVVACSDNPIVAAIRSDAWDGYPQTLYEVLEFIAERQIAGVVFLSGDEHIACVSDIEVMPTDGPGVQILSIHAAPLYAPLPFANARAEDFCGEETFNLSKEGHVNAIKVRVQSEFPLIGNGFALIDVPRTWRPKGLQIRYCGDRGECTVFR